MLERLNCVRQGAYRETPPVTVRATDIADQTTVPTRTTAYYRTFAVTPSRDHASCTMADESGIKPKQWQLIALSELPKCV
jgi:hypothetical protein